MNWNYRIVRDDTGFLTVREVYYDEKGNPNGMTSEVSPGGETLREFKSCMKLYKQALKRPVLDESEMKEPSDE